MASKRPASRLKAVNPIPTSSQNRTRPASKAASSSDCTPTASPTPTVPSATTGLIGHTQKTPSKPESNTQVVIRCRRRSEREIQDNSPIIVASNGAKSREISIETGAPQSSLGIVTLPPLRTYPFDIVFGPEADQAMIYHDVVSPMLEEVLMGYNCTLFAYGQTGTGKTYTMHGDLKPTPMGNPSADAGMIPRVLFRLFHSLETSNADYSVKISYTELYNEELRDLLANDLAPPTSSTQPMGMAAKDKNTEGLKIFDEAGKKGVFIQGLEEIPVKDCKDALRLLTKGSERRQIAATRFNDHSSRSHSIFSITVHVKETSDMGDDLLKVGKLNLVDLAGSENIGRSGAENKRAREAGMINQSLLTLGRVINALVDNAQHVPYRESKLTRLLQDSLGGRTKTCIIATVSPARSNMEETLSTLDYALRAKSIRNKPEVNQRMTRNGLLREYIAEIERLKNDLLAAREKNGIFFSEESWNQLNAEQELRQTELQEAKKQIEIIESQMRALREEFEQSIGLLMKRDEELKATKDKLGKTEIALNCTENQLHETKVALEEEVVVRKAHQDTERNLNIVAGELKKVAGESLHDNDGLFKKLERKSDVLESNAQTVIRSEEAISSLAQALSRKFGDLNQSIMGATTKLQSVAKEVEATEIRQLSSYSQVISEQLIRLQGALNTIQDSDKTETEAVEIVQVIVNEMQATFKDKFVTWGTALASTYSVLCDDLIQTNQKGMHEVESALGDVHAILEVVICEVQQYVKSELAALENSRLLVNKAAQEEIAHLRQQNEALVRMLKNEKEKGSIAKEKLMQQMSKALETFTNEQGLRLQESIDVLQKRNLKAGGALEAFVQQYDTLSDGMVGGGNSIGGTLQKNSGSAKRTRDGAFKILGHTKSTMDGKVHVLRDQLSASTATHTAWLRQQSSNYSASTVQAFKQHSTAKRARLDATDTLSTDIKLYYGQLQGQLASSSASLETTFDGISAEASALSVAASSYQSSIYEDLESLRAANRFLVEHGTRPDEPTGSTPKKRRQDFTSHWNLTQSREALLSSWRKAGKNQSSTGSSAHAVDLTSPPQDSHDEEEEWNMDQSLPTQKPVPVPTPHVPRSPSPGTLTGSTIVTPYDSPESQPPSAAPSAEDPPLEPIPLLSKKDSATTDPASVPFLAPLGDSRRKNIVTSRPSRRHIVR